MGIETDTHLFKIGDGVTSWTALTYGGLVGPAGTTSGGNSAVQAVANSNQSLSGLPNIDGVALGNNARVLLVAQSTTSQNGIWTTAASGSGAWVRPSDFATTSNQVGNAVDVESGNTYIASRWVMTGNTAVTVDVSPQTWIELMEGNMPAFTMQGNNTSASGPVQNLTVSQVQLLIGTTSTGKMLAASKGYNLN
jgi:hypothetical protein